MTDLISPATAALQKIVTPWPSSPRTIWSEQRLSSALRAQMIGCLSLPGQLLDALREDDEIPGALQTRVDATLGSDFSLRSSDPKSIELPARARALANAWDEIAPTEELSDLLSDYLMLGVGVATLDWDFGAKPSSLWTPRLRALPPEFLEWDPWAKQWWYTARDSERLLVTPGDGKWILMTRGQRPFVKGLIRALADLWRSKQITLRDWARYCQKHGLPILKAKMPIFRDVAEKEAFVDDLVDLQSEGVIGLPQDDQGHGYDVDLLEPTTVSWQTFQQSIERADRKIQVTLLGGNAATETVGSSGSRSTAEVQARGLVSKARRDADQLSCTLRDQLLGPYFAVNFAVGGDLPIPTWDVSPEADVQAWENSRLQFAAMLRSLREAGYSVANLDTVASDLGLELERAPEPTLTLPTAPAPAGGTAAQ